MTNFSVNGKKVSVDVDPDTPLLWVLRDELKLSGTKYGCGIAQCGACTVHLNGQPRRSCVTPIASVQDGEVVTIEGLSTPAGEAVKKAWVSVDVQVEIGTAALPMRLRCKSPQSGGNSHAGAGAHHPREVG